MSHTGLKVYTPIRESYGRPGFYSRRGQDLSLYSTASRPVLVFNKTSIEWVPRCLSPGVKRPESPLSSLTFSNTHYCAVDIVRILGLFSLVYTKKQTSLEGGNWLTYLRSCKPQKVSIITNTWALCTFLRIVHLKLATTFERKKKNRGFNRTFDLKFCLP